MCQVITINALSGGGKTTVVKALLERIPNSKALFFDDRDYDLASGIDDIASEPEMMQNDLEYYQEKGRDYFLESREIALQDADFVIDGSRKLDEITRDVMKYL